jgi:iron(II)-dependent oxidoreductase
MRFLLFMLTNLWSAVLFAQSLAAINWNDSNTITSFRDARGNSVTPKTSGPLFSFEVNKEPFTSTNSAKTVQLRISAVDDSSEKIIVRFTNISKDTISLRNVVPLGTSSEKVYIAGLGEQPLSRTHLFIPGKSPVNIIVPDNAWEMGYSEIHIDENKSVAALARRDVTSILKGVRKRFETILYPGGSVDYKLFAEFFSGEWQNGLRKIFHEKKLFDVSSFDSTLYNREDLRWIRHSYVMHLVMAWDKEFLSNDYRGLLNFIDRSRTLYGGDDVIGLWPTWPTLGLDQRNQFDLFKDLPGGTRGLKLLADSLRQRGTKFFVCYNPWDESTRSEQHLSGLADLIKETSADGIVLDTRGESSRELQDAADKVRKGVVMYSEGMAIPKHMPGIVSGRVHNALYYPPMLNLNKLIKPDFAIFRVAEVYKEPIKREYATSFFNGYGVEINQFAPGHPEWEEEQYRFFGRTSRILRENTFNFTEGKLTPLILTLCDSVWVNKWELDTKILYTIYSIISHGVNKMLFEVPSNHDFHFLNLWSHEEAEVMTSNEKRFVTAKIDGFNARDLGTNNEGEVSCIARLPKLLKLTLEGDSLNVSTKVEGEIRVWAGDPSYNKTPYSVVSENMTISLSEKFSRYEGKFVVQLMQDGILQDETTTFIAPGTPRLVSIVKKTLASKAIPAEMVKIPAGDFVFNGSQGDEFIPYPKWNFGKRYKMKAFYMDRYPVTNLEFQKFLRATKYVPADTSNFLKHWPKGEIKKGEESFPVVFISWEDADAYAAWCGKRLPTEVEWQYAAQSSALNEWPWKQIKPVTRKEERITETLTVKNIEGIDPKHANLGDGKLYAVGKYRKGVNPNGLYDLSGCVWQMTNDLYQSGSYQYIILKGGSYFKPSSSWWYVQGGPRELHYRQFLLRVSPGFERNATVGFRCVKD